MGATTLVGTDGEPATLHDLGGSGPALLLTHGSGMNAGMWATVVPHLRGRFHCFGLDFRGHGHSRPVHEQTFSLERRMLVAEVLDAVTSARAGGGPIFGAGHSLGAAMLLLTERDHPGTFTGIWAFEPVLVPDTLGLRPPSTLSDASRRRRMVFASADEALERFRSKPPYSACEADAVAAYVSFGTFPLPDGTVRLSCAGETEARVYETNEPQDFRLFRELHCPVVVAAGDAVAAGNELPPQLAAGIVAALPNARLQTLAGLTHFAPMENGAAVAAAINEALATVS